MRAIKLVTWSNPPDPPRGAPLLRCHEVARAVAQRLRASGTFAPAWTVEVVDGRFGCADHTWVELRGPGGEWVLDPYAVGRLPQVQVLDLDRSVPHRRWYFPGRVRLDVDETLVARLAAG